MNIDNSGLRITRGWEAASANAQLSPWVNERFPPWSEVLTAHHVARLTRRHPWTIRTLTFFGRFPKRRVFRSRAIGWLRSEVEEWKSGHMLTPRRPERSEYPKTFDDHPHRPKGPCSSRHTRHSHESDCSRATGQF